MDGLPANDFLSSFTPSLVYFLLKNTNENILKNVGNPTTLTAHWPSLYGQTTDMSIFVFTQERVTQIVNDMVNEWWQIFV